MAKDRKRRGRGITKGSAATREPRRKTAKQPTASDVTTTRSLRYDEMMASNEDSATALFELANATHVEFGVGGHDLTIQQDPAVVGTGGCVWETSYLMAQWLRPQLAARQAARGRQRLLEVGAGCGLLGIAAAHMGCEVLLTEQASAMANLRANVEANPPPGSGVGGGTARALELSWTSAADVAAAAASGPWDVLTGTDVVYKAELVAPLLGALRRCATPTSVVYLCLQRRDADAHATLLRLAPCYWGRVVRVPFAEDERLARFECELECFLLRMEEPRAVVLDEGEAPPLDLAEDGHAPNA
jgi:predicted nicotinamide N-methyase